MSRRSLLALVVAAAAGLVLALGAGVVLTAPDTALPWSVFGASGNSSSSTNYELGSTSGQLPIGQSTSTNFELGAGFWPGIVPPPNTPAGESVVVSPGSGVTLTFDTVTGGGTTTLTTSGTGPPPPQGFRLGNPPVYYDISTTATFAGNVEVCIDYDDSTFTPAVEAHLRLFHRQDGAWVDVTTFLDTDINQICGILTSLSLFLPVELIPEEDFDGDGCTNGAEVAPKGQASQGGGRDPTDYWDFYDTPDPNADPQRDRAITVADIFRVAARFGATGDETIDPLSKPAKTGYHPAYDRGGQVGANIWNQGPADGAIAVTDIFTVAAQFGHSCL